MVGNSEFKVKDASSYDKVAELYKKFIQRFNPPLVTRMMSLASIQPSQKILDVATGTGIAPLQIAKILNNQGKITAIDLSAGMLATAEQCIKDAGISKHVELRKMDAEALEFEDKIFDVIISLFAIRHFPNPQKALTEMYRVLQPEGKAVIAMGSGAPFSLQGVRHLLTLAPNLLKRKLGRQLVAPNLLNSLLEKYQLPMLEQEEPEWIAKNPKKALIEMMKKSGFVKLNTFWQGHQETIDTIEEFWNLQTTFSTIARKRLASATEQQNSKVKNEFWNICQNVQNRGGTMVYPYAAFYVVGSRS